MKVASGDAALTRKLQNASESQRQQQEDAISLDDAFETLEHDVQWKRAILDIVFSLVLLALLLAMLFLHFPASNVMYELGNSVSSTLAGSGADTITQDSTMKFTNIQTISDTFDWLTDSFVPSAFVTEDYNGNALAKDKWGRVAMFNKVLGGVVFNTTRAHIHPCQAEQFLVDLYPNCYDPDTTTVESVLISFDTNATEAASVISKLKARGDWLDFATQSLTITVVTYNGELQAYAVTELTLDFHQGGSVEPTAKTTTALADPYKTTAPIVLDVLVILGSLAMFAWHARRALDHALPTPSTRADTDRSRAGRLVQMIERIGFAFGPKLQNLAAYEMYTIEIGVAFYLMWFLIVSMMYDHSFRDNLARLVVSGKKFDVDSDERKGLLAVVDSLKRIADLTVPLRIFAVLEILLCSIRVLKAFHVHPRLSLLTRTISAALKQFRWVFVVFVVVLVTFASVGRIFFGDRVEGFSSLGKSFETCVNILFGTFDYATIQDVSVPAPLLFYWSYMIVVSLVLLNIMLAIVVDAYAEVSAAKLQTTKSLSLTRVLTNVARSIADALPKRTGRGGAQARQELRKMCREPDTCSSQARVLALCGELAHEDVVLRGRISDQLLRLVLHALRVTRGSGASSKDANGCAAAPAPETLVVSAASLKLWFAQAHVTDDVANATMAFLFDGMKSGDEAESTSSNSEGPKQSALDSSVVSTGKGKEEEATATKVVSDSSSEANDAVLRSPSARDVKASLARPADVSIEPLESAQGTDDTAAPPVAHLLQHIAAMVQTQAATELKLSQSMAQTQAMEQKLDLLLSKLVSE